MTAPYPTNPFSTEMKECPYPTYDSWRSDQPLVWSPEIHAWLVTGYEEARAILADHERFSSKNSVFGGPRTEHPEFPSMINQDEPYHRQLRALVSKAFTPRNIEEAWEPRIREYVDELMDAVERRSDGRMEVVGDLAYPLPVQMIAEIIGIPPALHAQFKHWSNLIVQNIGRIPEHGYEAMDDVAQAVGGPDRKMDRSDEEVREEMERVKEAIESGEQDSSLFLYFYEQIHDRRANPRDDLISQLIEAEVDGEHLSDNELMAFLVLLLVAGNETTTNLINHATRALATHADLQERVRANRDLVRPLMEEALRWEAPIQGFYRRAHQDVEVAGVQVKAGDALLVLYGAGNHDPDRYEEPEQFHLDRFGGQTGTRDHLAFGYGIHYCLGANLARLEAGLAINAILDRFSKIEPLTPEAEIEWWDTPFFRGPKAYEVSVTK